MKSRSILLLLTYMMFASGWSSAQNWGGAGGANGVAFSQSNVYYTSMAIGLNDTPYVAYLDQANNDAVSVKKFNGTSWVYVGSPGFSNTVSTNQGNEISLVLKISAAGQPFVFFQDSVSPPFSVMSFNGSTWSYVDTPGIGLVITNNFPQPDALSMDIDPSGNPYIAFVNSNHGSEASVFKHTAGSGWASVGPTLFTPGSADFLSLAIDHSGTPWLAFSDGNANGDVSVQKFNGNNWILQGQAGFSGVYIGGTAMAFDNNNNPYVAFSDGHNAYNANVMVYNGTVWTTVGSSDFSVGAAYYLNISMAFGNIPVVAYSDVNANKNATVEYYDGVGWVSLGTADFSSSEADWVSMAIAPNGLPYVSFEDDGNGHAASVYTFGQGVPSGINSIDNTAVVNVYPNPNSGNFSVRVQSQEAGEMNISIYDLVGQQVWNSGAVATNGNYAANINTNELATGSYILQVKTNSGITTQKLEIVR